MKPEDHILHYALGRLLGKHREPTDLSERIASAWERGESGTGTLPAGEDSPAAGPRRRSPILRWAPLAAATAAAALAWVWIGGGATEPPSGRVEHGRVEHGRVERGRAEHGRVEHGSVEHGRAQAGADRSAGGTDTSTGATPDRSSATPAPVWLARSEVPLSSFDHPDAAPVRELAPGFRAVVPDGPARTIELAGGSIVTAWPNTVFWLEDSDPSASAANRLHLAAGTMRIKVPSDSAAQSGGGTAIETGFAELTLRPGSLVVAQVESDDPDAPELSGRDLAARSLTDPSSPAPLLLSVEVRAGLARVTHRTPDGDSLGRALYERGAASFSNVPDERSLAAKEREWVSAQLVELTPEQVKSALVTGTNLANRDSGGEQMTPTELSDWLDARPTRWILLHEGARAALGEGPVWYGRSVITALIELPNQRALATVRALWREQPEAFTVANQLALAERGVFELERELRARVDAWEPGDEELPLFQAVWLAHRADDRGRALLETAAAFPISTTEDVLLRLQASVGLASLGNEAPLSATLDAIAREGLVGLKDGQPTAARDMLATCDYITAERGSGREVPLVGFFEQVDRYALGQAERYADLDRVRRGLEAFLID